MNPNDAKKVKEEIGNLLKAGFIPEVESSDWLFPIVVVSKKNGKLRICVGYRKLNTQTIKDPFPLSFTDMMLDEITGHEMYSFMDGYSDGDERPQMRLLPENLGVKHAFGPGSDSANKFQLHNGGGGTMLFVGELHWWTTDVELETDLMEFGALKNLKFYEERANGKSKGYCQVEFYDHAAVLACKEAMNGRKFHGRPAWLHLQIQEL
ncbi:hypothetical protein L7F22_059177 [Adiantum nelumboides]|nr:hypothetical protein [Adiantum nelumboides]